MKAYQVQFVVKQALDAIDLHRGEEGFRQNGDIALHLVVALEQAGLKVVAMSKAEQERKAAAARKAAEAYEFRRQVRGE